jgi:hypothetical protein
MEGFALRASTLHLRAQPDGGIQAHATHVLSGRQSWGQAMEGRVYISGP